MKLKHYNNLEILRFLAAFSIIILHYPTFTLASSVIVNDMQNSEHPFSYVFAPFAVFGGYGVQFFWLLSGFIFFSQYINKIKNKETTGYRFFINRFSRLYPLHIVTALIMFILLNIYNSYIYPTNSGLFRFGADIEDLLLHIFFASDWDTSRGYSLNGPIWSVSLEILAYLSFFLIARFLPKMIIPVSLIATILLFTLFPNDLLYQVFLYFYAGGLIYLLSDFASRKLSRSIINISVIVTLLFSAIGLFGIYLLSLDIFLGNSSPTRSAGLFLSVVFVFLIWGAALSPQLEGKPGKVAQFLGNLTYASYLIHYPIMTLIIIYCELTNTHIPVESELFLAFWILIVFIPSYFVYKYFERPVQDKIRSASYKQRKP